MISLLLLVAMMDAPAPQPSPTSKPKVKVAEPVIYPEPIDIQPEPEFESPLPIPTPAPPPLVVVPLAAASPVPSLISQANSAAFSVRSQMGALVTTTAEGGTGLATTIEVDAEGPLAVGEGRSLGRIGARINLTSEPGQEADSADVTNYRGVEIGLRVGRVVGIIGDVRTLVMAEGTFTTRLKGAADAPPLNRLSRSLGAGLTFESQKGNASLTTMIAYDEATTSCDARVICTGFHSGAAFLVYGQVPILDGRVLFGGDVSLNVGAANPLVRRRDIERVFVVVDPVAIFKKQ